MPEPRRHLRRFVDSRFAPRAAAHLAVAGLVVFASAFGLATRPGTLAGGVATRQSESFFGVVTPARGAAAGGEPLVGVAYTLDPANPAEHAVVERSTGRTYRSADAGVPKPTSHPVDPNATPLPAPREQTAQGSAQPPSGSVTRVAAPASGALAWPVPGGSISQGFHSGHLAIDIAARAGSTVVAADNGVITSAGWRNNGGGLVIEIDHGNGMKTVYNHLGSLWVGVGQAVARGQGIAGVGCTGWCTGPHVDFVVIVNGYIVNPLNYY